MTGNIEEQLSEGAGVIPRAIHQVWAAGYCCGQCGPRRLRSFIPSSLMRLLA